MSIKSKVGPLIAIIAIIVIVIWMVAGGNGITTALNDDTETSTSTSSEAPNEQAPSATEPKLTDSESADTETKEPFHVQAATLTASSTSSQMTLSGTTRASDNLSLEASYSGKVTKIHFNKGDTVEKGQAVISIDTRALNADIRKVRALVEEKKLDLEAATRLANQKLSSKVSLASAKSALSEVQADLQRLLIDAENAETRAPFTGILNDITVNVGQLLRSGDKIADLLSLQPLVISAQIPQKSIDHVALGSPVNITIGAGKNIEGNISFINKLANESTRSIEIEIEVSNPNNAIPAGISTSMSLQLADESAHGFSPALLVLNDEGYTAVKTLTNENIVELTPVEIIRSDRQKVWVSGLPDSVNIITVGQGFVKAGDTVTPDYQNSNQP